MKNGSEKYIGTVKYLGKLFDYINEHLFNGELTNPVTSTNTAKTTAF